MQRSCIVDVPSTEGLGVTLALSSQRPAMLDVLVGLSEGKSDCQPTSALLNKRP